MFDVRRLTFLVGTALLVATLQSAAADTLKIGVSASLTGPAGESGTSQITGAKLSLLGAKLAADKINKNGGILGRQINLMAEDNWTTNEGAILAFNQLAKDPDISAFVGPSFSYQIHAISPDVITLGKPLMIGGSDPKLTHMGNPWLFRCRPNDSYSARVMADFGVNTLNKRKWAIIHSTDAFGVSGKNALVDNLKRLGLEPSVIVEFNNNSQDFTEVVMAVKKSGSDVMSSYVNFDTDYGIMARQMRQLGVDITWIGSSGITNRTALELAGPALNGAYGIADFNEHSSAVAGSFSRKFRDIYHLQPDEFSAWAYDGMNILALAITNANSTTPEAIRAAILAIHGYQGAEGTYNFDQNGDGLHGYNIVHNQNGTIIFDRHIEFND